MAAPDDLARLPAAARAAAANIRGRWNQTPRVGLVLGTGLDGLAALVDAQAVMPYADIAGFPSATALGHAGRLIGGTLDGVPVAVMDGRCHFYEGRSLSDLMLPVYTLRMLGIRCLLLTNASGALNPQYAAGDVVVVEDHINLLFWGRAPRRRPRADVGGATAAAASADSGCGPTAATLRRGPAASVYDPDLIARALQIARQQDFVAHRGVYVAVTGPNYETRAEYRFLRCIGGDVVGMSTVPEAFAAAQCGLPTLALSTVTNVARPDRTHIVLAHDVVQAARDAEPHVRSIVRGIVSG